MKIVIQDHNLIFTNLISKNQKFKKIVIKFGLIMVVQLNFNKIPPKVPLIYLQIRVSKQKRQVKLIKETYLRII